VALEDISLEGKNSLEQVVRMTVSFGLTEERFLSDGLYCSAQTTINRAQRLTGSHLSQKETVNGLKKIYYEIARNDWPVLVGLLTFLGLGVSQGLTITEHTMSRFLAPSKPVLLLTGKKISPSESLYTVPSLGIANVSRPSKSRRSKMCIQSINGKQVDNTILCDGNYLIEVAREAAVRDDIGCAVLNIFAGEYIRAYTGKKDNSDLCLCSIPRVRESAVFYDELRVADASEVFCKGLCRCSEFVLYGE